MQQAIPYKGTEIAHNEQLVDNIVDKIDNLDRSNLPSSISNNGFRIQFEDTGGDGSISQWENAEKIPLDPKGSIVDQIEDKVKKQRGGRPLLIFYDADVSLLESEDMRQLLHGTNTAGPNQEVSDAVYQHRKVWGDYLRDKEYIPESGRTTYQKRIKPGDPKYEGDACICSGNEGLFVNRKFDRVAGVLFIDKPGYGYFFPNFYSQKLNFHPLYRDILRNMEIQSNKFHDLL